MIIFSLLPSMLINAQIIDYKSFKDELMNEVMFNKINEYASREGGYSLAQSSEEHRKIYKCIKRNDEKLFLDSLSSEINGILPDSSVGILDSISIKDIGTYQEISDKCIADWSNSQSDSFFMIGWGKAVDVISHYNKKTSTIYVSLIFRY
jgi:hypothetical protein